MAKQHVQYANELVQQLLHEERAFRAHPHGSHKLLVNDDSKEVSLDLTPFEATPQAPTAAPYFERVHTIKELLHGYREAMRAAPFESDLPKRQAHVDTFAKEFLNTLLARAETSMDDADARRIAAWVRHFDVYVAVKTVESLLNSKADLSLLELSEKQGWHVHFDHLAIRCGSALNRDAEEVAEFLCQRHGYTPSQVEEERVYRFADGWNAYPLYKILENGQILRLFLDESDGTNPKQIIQHWNRVYGYTAHHLAIRASRFRDGQREAVPIDEIGSGLAERSVTIMTPTGAYTRGLLVQVFTHPERTPEVPAEIKRELSTIAPDLPSTIENGKLLELLSRNEVTPELAQKFYELYGMRYDPNNPLHSVPAYQYFLPAQAAHVIRTSVEAQQPTQS